MITNLKKKTIDTVATAATVTTAISEEGSTSKTTQKF